MYNETLVEGNHGTGGKMDVYDSRDYQWRDLAGVSLPFDWDLGFNVEDKLVKKIPIKDQELSSACGGYAWAYYAEVLEALYTGTFEQRSPKFIYAQTHSETGGSAGRDNADVFKKQGVARESVLSSEPPTEANLTKAEDITPLVREDAKLSISISYAQTGTDINTVAQALRDNNGVILGINGENNNTWTTAFPRPPKNIQWRHWVYASGARMVKGKKAIEIINSWGDKIGNDGHQFLSQDYFESRNVWSGWTHVLKTIKTPPFKIDMSYGQSSKEIQRLQIFLKRIGYFSVSQATTGYYGDVTRSSIFHFQIDHVPLSLYESTILQGKICGKKTRDKLNTLV